MMPNDRITRGLGLSKIGFDAVNEQTGLRICQCICQLTVHDFLERRVTCRLQIKEMHINSSVHTNCNMTKVTKSSVTKNHLPQGQKVNC